MVSLLVGFGVSQVGPIAFVGLIAPHMVRLLIGGSYFVLLPGAFLLGAWLLRVADTLARTLLADAELPVGILLNLLGGPFFLFVIYGVMRKNAHFG